MKYSFPAYVVNTVTLRDFNRKPDDIDFNHFCSSLFNVYHSSHSSYARTRNCLFNDAHKWTSRATALYIVVIFFHQ
jgi:hypothetical protein